MVMVTHHNHRVFVVQMGIEPCLMMTTCYVWVYAHSAPMMWYAGGRWTMFNADQAVLRRNMVKLYGNSKSQFTFADICKEARKHVSRGILIIQVLLPDFPSCNCLPESDPFIKIHLYMFYHP